MRITDNPIITSPKYLPNLATVAIHLRPSTQHAIKIKTDPFVEVLWPNEVSWALLVKDKGLRIADMEEAAVIAATILNTPPHPQLVTSSRKTFLSNFAHSI